MQGLPEAEGHIGVLGGVFGGAIERDVGEGQAGFAGAGHGVVGDGGVVQMQGGEFVHAVPVGAGVLGEGNDHRVVERGGVWGAGAAEDQQVELRVLEQFQHAGVGQQRGERGDRLVGRDLFQRCLVGADMAQGHVAGAAGGGGQRDADEVGAQGVEAIGFGIDGDDPGLRGGGDPGLQRGEGGDAVIGAEGWAFSGGHGGWGIEAEAALGGTARGGGRGRCGDDLVETEPGDGAAEALGVQEVHQFRRIAVTHHQSVERERERGVIAQGDQLAGHAGGFGMFDQQVAALGWLHRWGGGQDGFKVAEFGDQLGGGFGADAGHAGNVVDAVADQGLGVDQLFWPDAEFFDHLGNADGLVLHRVLHGHAGADQLHQIFVGRDDDGRAAGIGGGLGVGGDQVVGFPVRQVDPGDAEGFRGGTDQRKLRDEFWRGFGAVGFVGIIQAVAEGIAPGVENHREMGADMVLQQARQHVGEAEDRVNRGAVRARHRRQGVKGTEDEARPVDQHQMRNVCSGRRGRGVHVSDPRRGRRRRSARRGGSNRGRAPACRECAGRRADDRGRRCRHRTRWCGRRHG